MTDTSLLSDFKSSCSKTSRDELIQEGVQIAKKLEEYNSPLPYISTDIKGRKTKVELTPDGHFRNRGFGGTSRRYDKLSYHGIDDVDLRIPEITKLISNGNRRLAAIESQFNKVLSLYPTDVAELSFSGTNDKVSLLYELVSKRQNELNTLLHTQGDLAERLFITFKVSDFTISYDFSVNYKRYTRGIRVVVLPKLDTPRALKFLTKFKDIKQEVKQKLDKMLVKEGI